MTVQTVLTRFDKMKRGTQLESCFFHNFECISYCQSSPRTKNTFAIKKSSLLPRWRDVQGTLQGLLFLSSFGLANQKKTQAMPWHPQVQDRTSWCKKNKTKSPRNWQGMCSFPCFSLGSRYFSRPLWQLSTPSCAPFLRPPVMDKWLRTGVAGAKINVYWDVWISSVWCVSVVGIHRLRCLWQSWCELNWNSLHDDERPAPRSRTKLGGKKVFHGISLHRRRTRR